MPRKSNHRPAPQFCRRDQVEAEEPMADTEDTEETEESEEVEAEEQVEEDDVDSESEKPASTRAGIQPADAEDVRDDAEDEGEEDDVEEPIEDTEESEDTDESEEEVQEKPEKQNAKKKSKKSRKSKKAKIATKKMPSKEASPKKKSRKEKSTKLRKSKKTKKKGMFAQLTGFMWGSSSTEKKKKKPVKAKAKKSIAKKVPKNAVPKKKVEKKAKRVAKKASTKAKPKLKAKKKEKTKREKKSEKKKSSLLAFLNTPITFKKSKPKRAEKKPVKRSSPKKRTAKSPVQKSVVQKKRQKPFFKKMDVHMDESVEKEQEEVPEAIEKTNGERSIAQNSELRPFLLQDGGRPSIAVSRRKPKTASKAKREQGMLASLLMTEIPAPRMVDAGMRAMTGGVFSEAPERKVKKAERARKAKRSTQKNGDTSLLMTEIPAPALINAGLRALTGGFFSGGPTGKVKKAKKAKRSEKRVVRKVEEIEELEITKNEKADRKKEKKEIKEVEAVEQEGDDASPQEQQTVTLTVRKHKKRGGVVGVLKNINYIGMGKYRSLFIQNVAMMLNAGLPLIEALETYNTELKNRAMRKVVSRIHDAVESGHPFWRAMEDQYLFTPYEIALVRVGEEAGNLARNMEYLAEQQEKDRALRQKVKMAMIYPSIVMVLMFIVVVGLGMFVLPNLIQVLYSLNADLPATTLAVIAATEFFVAHGKTVVPACIGGMLVLLFLAKYTPFRIVAQWFVFRIPGIGRLAKEASIARFGVVLGGLLQAGVPLVESLQSLEDVTTIWSYKRLYGKLVDRIAIGDSFSVVFKDIKRSKKLIPTSVQQLVITGERSGSLAETFQNVATIYEKKAEETAKKLPVILEPMLLLLIGGLVGFIAFSIIIPIYTAVGSVSGAR